ncbi:diguanylate cyclase (GGDEF)-like protein [Actinoplanes lutulentus]|uniref:Diguanylate cyclase (GGDEF)-like protein n=1 Tax=Actinoplanes lutulentus TaxID=1287878 RepID=A0A327Z0Y7_9ACTN|nr:GGDEF domain-containing protein [Actinoplanes lutulentus]MBB2947469.1 diguanylate cyclase (GGDEF)-like protein [Actinoplanes lutulentus]RAK28076.1 diguanylate cyclase (GGDEF)-like protein [Actinoplanes lutulentus]
MNQWRRRAIRVAAAYGFIPALLCGAYLAGTWDGPNRAPMLVVVLVMMLFATGGWLAANRLSESRIWWRVPLLTGALINLAGDTALGLLDGGAAGPLGTLLPASAVFLAITVPPRAFLGFSVLSVLAYGILVFFGDPPPPGYAMVHLLAYGAAAVLCLRHSTILASLRRRLSHASRTDPLTGCLNRRGFDERVAAELAKGRTTTLVLLDLDHFKSVNDTYGHQAGDDLLAWAGHELLAEVRATDAVGRLGGDEFAILLPGTDAAEAAEIVTRVRARLAGATPSSLGFATFPADADDADSLSIAADSKLYADKSAHVRQAATEQQVEFARTHMSENGPAATVAKGERRRHSIADPGWMAMAQTLIALVYVGFFTEHHDHRAVMAAICVWGFAAGLAVVASADWLSRARAARPLMLAFATSSFLSCAAIAALDGGVDGPLGVGMLLSIPLLVFGMRTSVAVPVAVLAAGLYTLVATTVGDPNPWYVALNLFGTAATSFACAVQGRAAARQRRMLTRLARVDVLTGVLNRRGFAERFTADPGTGLLVVDLDKFKQLNDAHGHAAGDDLLRWVAQTLRTSVRPDDLVGRLGGDEFVLLVSGNADTVATELRDALAERTGASIGVAIAGRDGDGFDSLYAVADARLYQQKLTRPASYSAAAGL